MPLFVLSDLHLADDTVVSMFDEDVQGKKIVALCDRVAREKDAELVLLGDVFDLTAMTPPPGGVAKFGAKMGVDLVDLPARSAVDMCASARRPHERTLKAIDDLASGVTVTLVPGNHDHHFGAVDGRAALDAAGLRHVRIEPETVRTLGGRVVLLQHGHALDPDNAEPSGKGEMLTRVLHHAVVPMLQKIPRPPNVPVDPARLVLLRPEERMMPVLERWLSRSQYEAFMPAFLDLLVLVGSLSSVESWFATPARLRERLDDADHLWERTGTHARDALRGLGGISGSIPRPDVVVLGHTHVPDWAVEGGKDDGGAAERQRLYVNLGSWTARANDALGPFDDTLPVLRIEDGPSGLSATFEELSERAVLGRFESSAT